MKEVNKGILYNDSYKHIKILVNFNWLRDTENHNVDFFIFIPWFPQKGQHLEPFIMNFINSCESPKPKPSKPELTILSPTSENNKKVLCIVAESH